MNDSEIVAFVKPFTSVSTERINNVLSIVERVVTENIPGDLAEVGVWKGGLIMAMALKCKQLGVSRIIHVYDTFSGMTPPTSHDVDLDGQSASTIFDIVKCYVSLDEVKHNISLVDYPHIEYHVGDITQSDKNSFPTFSVLRLDTDWYESTKFELTYMEPRVSPYGFIIVDDYGHWKGSRKAVDEFKPPNLHWIDYTGVWWQRDFGRSRLESGPDSPMKKALLENFHHFIALGSQGFHGGCGSYLFDGQIYKYQPETLKKQEALFNTGTKVNRVLEIGVYLGHSLLLLLLSNPSLQIVCIDNDSKFSPYAVEYLNKHFNNRITFYLGTSKQIVSSNALGLFDCIHIDADHSIPAVLEDFRMTKPLAAPKAYFIFDDYEAVRSLIDGFISSNELTHVETPWCLWTNIVTLFNKESS
jgi:hypothetical protein